ncbi:MAG: choice-of-anchor D domain-containing protein [Comamonadaceae bacterium]|nr:choice-of-anchor D domain-containing protein [Comamonadaceae bacterium]
MKLLRIIVTLGCLVGLAAPLQAQTCNASVVPESTPTAEFTDADDGTVTHLRTGLTWKRCAEGQAWNGTTCIGTANPLNWQNALFAARAASFAGHTDWRLPNVKELESIIEGKCYNPSINASIFPNTAALGFWSASAFADDMSLAWYVLFIDGDIGNFDKSRTYQVRLVRAGRAFGSFDALDTSSRLFLQATSLSFAVQNIGSTSAAQNVTLSNTGNQPLTLGTIAASSGYTVTHNCGSSLAAVASCTLSIRFAPAASGTLTGSVIIASDAPGSPHSIGLTGIGQAGALSMSSTALSFGSQYTGTTSPAQTITLSNVGGAALTFTSIVASSDYRRSTTCGASLLPGANCTVSVAFVPTAAVTYLGSLLITSDSVASPHTVNLSGLGVASPGVALLPGSLTFAGQLLGSPSLAKTIILLNSGTAVLSSISITTSGDFTQTNTCGTSQAAGASCTIYVVFTPIAAGNGMGSLSVSSNAPGSPQSVGLSGTGISPNAPQCSLSATPAQIQPGRTTKLTAICTPSATSFSWSGGTCPGTIGASCSASPSITTTYGMTGSNSDGSSTASATVTVQKTDLTPILMLLLD